ncbi:MAG: FtsQ-type POTRA domain-containing protein [Thermoleophilaceae bacterium]|nr:FtsQ-type POTRA domain-containing protein [Thermoleophilaceae bacterium]
MGARATGLFAPAARPLAIAAVLLLLLGGLYVFWLRDLPLFRVEQLRVVGLTTGQADQIEGDFARAGRKMTTLNLDRAQLERVAARYPVIRSFTAEARFPDGLRIDIDERLPGVVLEDASDRRVPVAADGFLLEGVDATDLPVIEVEVLPTGDRLTDADALSAIRVAAGAPPPLGTAIERVDVVAGEPIEVLLRGGVRLLFGDDSGLDQKWAAVAAVLADAGGEGLSYIDVSLPERPVAGGLGAGARKR